MPESEKRRLTIHAISSLLEQGGALTSQDIAELATRNGYAPRKNMAAGTFHTRKRLELPHFIGGSPIRESFPSNVKVITSANIPLQETKFDEVAEFLHERNRQTGLNRWSTK